MEKYSYIMPVEMRTCLWHPKELASVWSGHAHILTPIGVQHYIVGLCKKCAQWESNLTKYREQGVLAEDSTCKGCYGNFSGLR